MKKITLLLTAAIMASFALVSCVGGTYDKGNRDPKLPAAKIDTLSYCVGVYLGKNVQMSDFGEINLGKMHDGFMDVLNKKEIKMTDEQIGEFLNSYMMARIQYVAERNMQIGKDFLEENKTKEGVHETASGLQYKHIQEGTGIAPAASDTVEVHYTGTLIDGTEFDSSKTYGHTISFPLNRVISGWSEGIQLMKEGGKMMLYIPSEMAYGSRSTGPIPANSTLIFEVELVKVKPVSK